MACIAFLTQDATFAVCYR